MGVYQAPTFTEDSNVVNGQVEDAAFTQLHIGFYPPLLRSSSVKKYLVG